MKNLLLLFIVFIGSAISVSGQVTKINYVLNYNCESNLYEVGVKVVEGSASSILHRAQFNAQITMVVPAGVAFVIVERINPIMNNQNYDGNVPTEWSQSNAALSPEAMPNNDFYPITPRLAPASFYNDLEEGSEVILFSCKIGDSNEYNPEYRFYNNETDPDVNDELGVGAYRNGFTIGGPNQIYNENEYTSCLTSTNDDQFASFAVYPSPFSEEFNIELSEDVKSISIIDYSGNKVYSSNGHSRGTVSIDAKHFASGIYMVHIETDNSHSVKRVVKM